MRRRRGRRIMMRRSRTNRLAGRYRSRRARRVRRYGVTRGGIRL